MISSVFAPSLEAAGAAFFLAHDAGHAHRSFLREFRKLVFEGVFFALAAKVNALANAGAVAQKQKFNLAG